jgi:hypothetical protein
LEKYGGELGKNEQFSHGNDMLYDYLWKSMVESWARMNNLVMETILCMTTSGKVWWRVGQE